MSAIRTTSCIRHSRVSALSAMVFFFIFLSVLLCKPAGLAVHCENLLFSLMSNYGSFASRSKKPWVLCWAQSVWHIEGEKRSFSPEMCQTDCAKHKTQGFLMREAKLPKFQINEFVNSHSKLLTKLVSKAKLTEKGNKPLSSEHAVSFYANK